ncbi:nitrite/sulfite reductase [Alphaproteobacteria bacterium LSUCC0684]
MYQYTDFDHTYLKHRIREFREHVKLRVQGVLTEDEFKPLRLQNGLYLQLHAYMLRVAIPYGTLSGRQMRKLADIAEAYDKGYGHFTTRQNIQFNWIRLPDVPDALEALAEVDMHTIQTSGNCIRNVTADHFAGAVADEVEDPRIIAEMLRQWSTGHPEYAFLPRKFKIAVTGSADDRAVVAFHDIGIRALLNEVGEKGYKIWVGGGLGRTPRVGRVLTEFLPEKDLLAYIDSILHVYNRFGRRDNKYKARIKILIDEIGIDEARHWINSHFQSIRGTVSPPDEMMHRIRESFTTPDFSRARDHDLEQDKLISPGFAQWCENNLARHRDPLHRIVSISLKAPGQTPGDASAEQMRVLADLAEHYAHDEIRVSHEQNIILPHVPAEHLLAVYTELAKAGLATSNIGLLSDIIACPGMDYCALATARSIPVAKDIALRFAALRKEHEIGPLKIKISGCINACGHHHVGHIGILGLDRAGVENYQITLGGDGTEDATLGERTGPGFAAEDLLLAIERIIQFYLGHRHNRDETFLAFYRRVGLAPFKTVLYPDTAMRKTG